MDQEKVQARCDELRDLIGRGPGRDPEVLLKALTIVRSLRGAAEWEFPQQILGDLKERLTVWFSERVWRGDTSALHGALMQSLAELCASWERSKDNF
jgi:hypothetical protein